MKYIVLLATTAFIATFQPLCAAFVWTLGVSLLHAHEETRGQLWSYFANLNKLTLLSRVSPFLGFILVVAPAIFVQGLASSQAFLGEAVAPFWLAMLVGARLGDALFSHAIPFIEGKQPNPGSPTAAIYVVDGLLLLQIFSAQLMSASGAELIAGFTIGAGFFAAVQPILLPTIERLLPLLNRLGGGRGGNSKK